MRIKFRRWLGTQFFFWLRSLYSSIFGFSGRPLQKGSEIRPRANRWTQAEAQNRVLRDLLRDAPRRTATPRYGYHTRGTPAPRPPSPTLASIQSIPTTPVPRSYNNTNGSPTTPSTKTRSQGPQTREQKQPGRPVHRILSPAMQRQPILILCRVREAGP